jgi:hypothetical protein
MTVSAWELTKYIATGLSFHAGVKYNNRGIVTGGLSFPSVLHEVVQSPDGTNIEPIVLNPTGLDARFDHAMCVFDERMWVSGGLYNPIQARSDILSSEDGLNWIETYDGSEGFYGHKMVAFGNQKEKLVLLGGATNSPQQTDYLNEVVKSSDGTNFEVVQTATPIWGGREGFGCLVYKNRIYVFGGRGQPGGVDGCYNDVWYTEDLIHWHKVLDHAPWGARSHFGYCEWDERMWVIGGKDYVARTVVPKKDVWFSRDGLHWEQGFDFPTTVYAPVAMPINNHIHVHGGVGNEHNVYRMNLG